jgi:hypothetical protein
VHDERCAQSRSDPTTCECACGGRLHGSAWTGPASNGRGVRPIPPRRRKRKIGRVVTLAVAVTVAGTVGGLAVTGSFDASTNGGDDLSVQVNVDLNNAISGLSSLQFGGRLISNVSTSGSTRPTNCAENASGQVRQFLTHYPCKQFAAEKWAITRRSVTTQVVFSWVEMSTTVLAGQYKVLVDTYGTGNPPGVPTAFNGRCYASGQQDSTVWTVEVQPTENLNIDRIILQAAVKTKLSPDYLDKHCVI